MFKKIILSSILLSGFNLYNLSAMEEPIKIKLLGSIKQLRLISQATEELMLSSLASVEGEPWTTFRAKMLFEHYCGREANLKSVNSGLMENMHEQPILMIDIFKNYYKMLEISIQNFKSIAEKLSGHIDFTRIPVRVPDNIKGYISNILGSQNFRPEQLIFFSDVLVTVEKLNTYLKTIPRDFQ